MGVVIALGVAAALAWSAPSPPVHAILERSTPAAGDTLAAVPPQLLLSFSGAIEEAGAALRILGPAGRTWELEPRRADGDAESTLVSAIAVTITLELVVCHNDTSRASRRV